MVKTVIAFLAVTSFEVVTDWDMMPATFVTILALILGIEMTHRSSSLS